MTRVKQGSVCQSVDWECWVSSHIRTVIWAIWVSIQLFYVTDDNSKIIQLYFTFQIFPECQVSPGDKDGAVWELLALRSAVRMGWLLSSLSEILRTGVNGDMMSVGCADSALQLSGPCWKQMRNKTKEQYTSHAMLNVDHNSETKYTCLYWYGWVWGEVISLRTKITECGAKQ